VLRSVEIPIEKCNSRKGNIPAYLIGAAEHLLDCKGSAMCANERLAFHQTGLNQHLLCRLDRFQLANCVPELEVISCELLLLLLTALGQCLMDLAEVRQCDLALASLDRFPLGKNDQLDSL
jgi:hypothetical protein